MNEVEHQEIVPLPLTYTLPFIVPPVGPLCGFWVETPAGPSTDCSERAVWGRRAIEQRHGLFPEFDEYACYKHEGWLRELPQEDV